MYNFKEDDFRGKCTLQNQTAVRAVEQPQISREILIYRSLKFMPP